MSHSRRSKLLHFSPFKKEEIIMDRVWKNLISEENIVKWRRYFHKYPELSFHEKETSAIYI